MSKNNFQQQVWPLKDRLYRFAHRLLSDGEEAADVVQEVFLKALDQQSAEQVIHNWEAWCITLTKRLSFDRLKSKRWQSRRNEVPEHLATSDTPEQLAESADLAQHYQSFIKNLPAQQRAVFFLREEEGRSYKEIAEALGIEEGLVKATLSRARKSLREAILQLESYRNDAY